MTADRAASGDGVGDEPNLVVLDDPDQLFAAAAERIAADLVSAVERRGRADWATTGGSTPVGIYRALSLAPLRDQVPWQAVHVWWGDDRFVPRDHPQSNVAAFDDVLIASTAHAGLSGTGAEGTDVLAGRRPGVWIPPEQIHAMPMSAAIGQGRDTAWVAREYERELRDAGLPLGANGVPALDVVLAGMGPDGHVLSDFPGSTAFDGGGWVVPVPAPTHLEPKVARVSLSPAFLEAARDVLVVVFGGSKAEIIGTVLGPERDSARWPIQHARRSNATWLLDRAAATNLPSEG